MSNKNCPVEHDYKILILASMSSKPRAAKWSREIVVGPITKKMSLINVQSCLQLKFKFEIAQRAKSDSFCRLCKSTFAQFKRFFFQTSNSDVFHSN